MTLKIKRNVFVFSLAASILSTAIMPHGTLFASNETISPNVQHTIETALNQNKSVVSREDAVKAAAWQVLNEINGSTSQTKWKEGFKLQRVTDVFDPSGKLVAYLVNILNKDGQLSGYVMVSAFLDDEPIISYSDQGSIFNTEKVDDKLKSKGLVAESPKLTWFGGVKLATSYTLKDDVKKHYMSPSGEETTISSTEQVQYPVPTSINENSRKMWETIKKIKLMSPGETNPGNGVTDVDPATWETNYDSIDRYYIDNPYDQNQWIYTYNNGVAQYTGCSPTAGSNLVMYYAQNYPSLNPTRNQRDIVMSLRNHMGTKQMPDGSGETNFWNIDDGLQSYFRANGRPNAEVTNGDFPDFSIYKMQLKNYGPVLQSYWSQSYFGNHTVYVVGYKEFVRSWYQANSKYLVVRNNWDDNTFNLYVKWGTWNTNVITYVNKP
ncbi:hypothetical protein [Paenibacillus ehimensis]|uniref:hypothetical protein n=1 Tax=Paenibacillus ehimensis TaxID=79264 RepID=UPI0004728D12|nr:hypothetical protein [Paenibacillus ehimensis]